MVSKIWKYRLFTRPDINITTILNLRSGDKILKVATEPKYTMNDIICIWVMTDLLDDTVVEREFLCLGTGKDLPDGVWKHLDSVREDSYMWHIFEKENE